MTDRQTERQLANAIAGKKTEDIFCRRLKMQDWKLTDKNFRRWKMTDTALKDMPVHVYRGPCTFELIQLRVIRHRVPSYYHKKTLYTIN